MTQMGTIAREKKGWWDSRANNWWWILGSLEDGQKGPSALFWKAATPALSCGCGTRFHCWWVWGAPTHWLPGTWRLGKWRGTWHCGHVPVGADETGARHSFLLLPELGTQATGVGDSRPELTNHPNPRNPITEHGQAVSGSCRQSMLTAPTTSSSWDTSAMCQEQEQDTQPWMCDMREVTKRE